MDSLPVNNQLPLSVKRYSETLPLPNRSMAYLCLDDNLTVVDSGGELEKCGAPLIENGVLASDQLPVIGPLLPVGETAVVLENTQITEDSIIDLHLFADAVGQWVLIIDNAEAALKLQSEQQDRLCNDIIEEQNTKKKRVE